MYWTKEIHCTHTSYIYLKLSQTDSKYFLTAKDKLYVS